MKTIIKGETMQANFVLDSNELDYSFIDKLKIMFQNKRIELVISELDDTEYLCASKANKDILLASISNIESGENLIVADPKLFQ
jgi:antitoxin YefM